MYGQVLDNVVYETMNLEFSESFRLVIRGLTKTSLQLMWVLLLPVNFLSIPTRVAWQLNKPWDTKVFLEKKSYFIDYN